MPSKAWRIMNISARSMWALLLVVGSGAMALQRAEPQAHHAPPYRITALQAKLFYEHSATFSEDIFANPQFSLSNVVIGEGSAKEPSSSTLILVVIGGRAGAYEPARKVEITATRKSVRKNHQEPVVRRVVETSILSKEGRQFIPLWLYDTGGEPITIEAHLVGQASSSPIRKVIDFQMGE